MGEDLSVVLLEPEDARARRLRRYLLATGPRCRVGRVASIQELTQHLREARQSGDGPHAAVISGRLPEDDVLHAVSTCRTFSEAIAIVVAGDDGRQGRLAGSVTTWRARFVPETSLGLLGLFLGRALHEARQAPFFLPREDMPVYAPIRTASGRIWPHLMMTMFPRFTIKDAELRFVYVTEGSAADMGTTPEQVVGKDDFSVFPPQIARVYQAEDRAVLKAGKVVVDRDGSRVKVPIPGPDGKAVAVLVGTLRGVEAEAPIRMICQWCSMVETLPEAFAHLDLAGTITGWSPGAEALYGLVAQEAEGRPVTDLADEPQRPELRRQLQRVLRGETVDEFETRHLTREGRHAWVALTMAPIIDMEGSVVAIAMSARDISRRKRVEQELEGALSELASSHAELERLTDENADERAQQGPHGEEMRRLARRVRTSPLKEFDFHQEARCLGLSMGRFRHLFREHVGHPPLDYLLLWRMRRAARELRRRPQRAIGQVAEETGYDDPAHFSKLFKSKIGVSPRQYRNLHGGS